MSLETIHATAEGGGHPGGKQPREREFEEFLRHAVPKEGDDPLSLRAWLDLAEAWKIMRTLRTCRGNRSAAARILGIGRRTLYAKMDKLQIAATWELRNGNSSATDEG